MSAAALRSQLNEHISYMYATGIVDEYYQQLQSPEDEGFVPEVINMFLGDADRMLNDITSLLSVSYHRAQALCSPYPDRLGY
ncbi:hypothetical protein ACQJBY_037780 [Aegilops geniculata]